MSNILSDILGSLQDSLSPQQQPPPIYPPSSISSGPPGYDEQFQNVPLHNKPEETDPETNAPKPRRRTCKWISIGLLVVVVMIVVAVVGVVLANFAQGKGVQGLIGKAPRAGTGTSGGGKQAGGEQQTTRVSGVGQPTTTFYTGWHYPTPN